MLKFNLSNFIIFSLAASITFYAAKITPYSPIYIIYLLLLPISMLNIIKKNYISVSFDVFVIFFFLLYIISTQLQFILSGEFINLFISLFAYLYIRLTKKMQNELSLLYIFKMMIWISILLLSIDSIYRITHPAIPNMDDFDYISNSDKLWFYIYKYNTLLFADSNTVALIVLVLYFTVMSIEYYKKVYSFKYEKLFLFLLLLFSLSRSAYIAFIIGIAFVYIKNQSATKRLIYFLIIFFLFILIGIYLSTYLETDGSFQSKFSIMALAYNKFQMMSLSDILFGIGMGEAKSYLGIYPHLLFLTYFFESGLIGLAFFILFMFSYIYKYNSIILFPMLISGFSFFVYLGTPFLFVPLAMLANLMDQEKSA